MGLNHRKNSNLDRRGFLNLTGLSALFGLTTSPMLAFKNEGFVQEKKHWNIIFRTGLKLEQAHL